MAARLPLLHKTPFVLDPRPLLEATSPHAGLLGVQVSVLDICSKYKYRGLTPGLQLGCPGVIRVSSGCHPVRVSVLDICSKYKYRGLTRMALS
jgi:hypothetical protein